MFLQHFTKIVCVCSLTTCLLATLTRAKNICKVLTVLLRVLLADLKIIIKKKAFVLVVHKFFEMFCGRNFSLIFKLLVLCFKTMNKR